MTKMEIVILLAALPLVVVGYPVYGPVLDFLFDLLFMPFGL